MKYLFTIAVVFLSSLNGFSQNVKKEVPASETKMDQFSSKTGVITKFIDTKLPNLKMKYGGSVETRVRKLISGNQALFFYQIEYSSEYTSTTASVEYSDLLEVIKALGSLKADLEKDVASNPDYLENKFTTNDGFQVGYFVDKNKPTWYLKLDKYGSKNTIFISDGLTLETALNDAKVKIEELKK